MTREQHRASAALTGAKTGRHAADGDAQLALSWALIAGHHGRKALECPTCRGNRLLTVGFGGPQVPCQDCLVPGTALATGLRTREWLTVETVPLNVRRTPGEPGAAGNGQPLWTATCPGLPGIWGEARDPETAKHWARQQAWHIFRKCQQDGTPVPQVLTTGQP